MNGIRHWLNKIVLALILHPGNLAAQQTEPYGFLYPDMKAVHKYCTDMFETLQLQPGDTVVCIGSANGWAEVALATLVDSVVFYLEDVDSTRLNRSQLDWLLAHYARVRGRALTCTFHLQVGAEYETGLPDGMAEKVWMMSVWHHVQDKNRFLAEMDRIMVGRAGARLYISERVLKKPRKKPRKPQDICKPSQTPAQIEAEMKMGLPAGQYFLRQNHGAVTLIFERLQGKN